MVIFEKFGVDAFLTVKGFQAVAELELFPVKLAFSHLINVWS